MNKKSSVGLTILIVVALLVGGYIIFGDLFCRGLGGQEIQTGCGIAGCASVCRMPYLGGGRTCTASWQCIGKCVKYSEDASSGQCQKWPAANCEKVWEFETGKLISDCRM